MVVKSPLHLAEGLGELLDRRLVHLVHDLAEAGRGLLQVVDLLRHLVVAGLELLVVLGGSQVHAAKVAQVLAEPV